MSNVATSELAAFDDSVAGVIEKIWGERHRGRERRRRRSCGRPPPNRAGSNSATAGALDLAVAATRRLGRAACPLPLLDGYAATELFDEPGIACG